MTITADCSLNCLRPKVQRAALFDELSVHIIMSSRNIAADMIEAPATSSDGTPSEAPSVDIFLCDLAPVDFRGLWSLMLLFIG